MSVERRETVLLLSLNRAENCWMSDWRSADFTTLQPTSTGIAPHKVVIVKQVTLSARKQTRKQRTEVGRAHSLCYTACCSPKGKLQNTIRKANGKYYLHSLVPYVLQNQLHKRDVQHSMQPQTHICAKLGNFKSETKAAVTVIP